MESGGSVSSNFIEGIRQRINLRVQRIIALHSMGELVLSICVAILLSLNTFSRLDLTVALCLFCAVLFLQRHLYIYYLSEVLPDLVSEAVFMGEGYTHKRLLDEMSEVSDNVSKAEKS